EGQPRLEFTAVATDEPAPRHTRRGASAAVGETIALAVRDLSTGQRFFCANSLHDAGEEAEAWMREADCVLVSELDALDGAGSHGHEPPPDVAWFARAARFEAAEAVEAIESVETGARAPRRHQWLALADAGRADAPRAPARTRWGFELAADRMEIEL
ncbi:MAG: hypothetical protein AB9M60_21905, partial [Leptothrix sp. (in: b-proteobacteria)]